MSKTYQVVEYAGQDREQVVFECDRYMAAIAFIEDQYGNDEEREQLCVDILTLHEDGRVTCG